MADLQSRLGDGINRLKGGIEQGKQKLQVAQQVSGLKKKVRDASHEKAKLLTELGQATFYMLRNGAIVEEELQKISESIVGYDFVIYQSLLKIKELTEVENQLTCECGNELMPNNKFCGNCGNKVETKEEAVEVDTIPCQVCEVEIPKHSQFCACCGSKISA